MSTLPTIDANLDPGIASVVLAMRQAGLPTFSSCDGHGRDDPWIVLKQHLNGDVDVLLLYGRVVDWLFREGLTGCDVSIVRQIGCGHGEVCNKQGEVIGRLDEHFVRVQWWGREPINDWKKSVSGND